jgi:hypothetical protein
MPIPPSAEVWEQQLDPKDIADFVVDISDMLEAGETVASYSFTLGAEAAALGLEIGTGSYAVTQPTTSSFRLWLNVNTSFWADAAFDGAGASLPIVLDFTTNNSPARRFQRTLVVQVAQQ